MSDERSSAMPQIKEAIPTSNFKAAPYNPRRIDQENMEHLKSSIWSHTETLKGWSRAAGFRLVDPIIVNSLNSRIVGGHQRVDALRELGQDWVHEDDVRYVHVDDERKEAALNVALNNPNLAGGWDYPKLKDIVVEIDLGDFDFTAHTGFTQQDLDSMFSYKPGEPNQKEYDENIETEHKCPKCGYVW